MSLNVTIGVIVSLVGMTLVASIAVNLHTQHMLKQCREILDFCFDMAEREGENELEEPIRKEGTA